MSILLAQLYLSVILIGPLLADTFYSPLTLKIYSVNSSGGSDRLLGFTPNQTKKEIEIPRGLWYIRPIGSLSTEKLEAIAKELASKRIPGLDLSRRWDISNEDLQVIADLDRLEFLDLTDTRINDGGLQYLHGLKNLKVLALNRATSDEGLKDLLFLEKLEILNLRRCKITDIGIARIKNLKRIEILDLSDTKVSTSGLEDLQSLHQLRFLTLGPNINDSAASALKNFKHLIELDLTQTSISNEGLMFLDELPRLQNLFTNSNVSDTGLKHISNAKSLKRLDLSNTHITSLGLEALEKLENLEELALSNTRINDDGLKHIAKLKKIETLELSGTKVSSNGLYLLQNLEHLETLSMSWKSLNDKELQALSSLRKLQTVILDGSPISEETFNRLKNLAKRNPGIRFNPYAVIEPKKNTIPNEAALDDRPFIPPMVMPATSNTTGPRLPMTRFPTMKQNPSAAPSAELQGIKTRVPSSSPALAPLSAEFLQDSNPSPTKSPLKRTVGLKRVEEAQQRIQLEEIINAGYSSAAPSLEPPPENTLGEIVIDPNSNHP